MEVPVFVRVVASDDCESGHPPRRPPRHYRVQVVYLVSVCVAGCIFAGVACERMLYVTCIHRYKMATEVVVGA